MSGNQENIRLTVIRVEQPIGEFFIGAIDSRLLNRIATADVREFEEGNALSIAGIQRTLSVNRVKEIGDYVNYEYATFPTSVVLAVDERCVSLKQISKKSDTYELIIAPYEGGDDESIKIEESATIIDGQHRLAGLQRLRKNKSFEVNVSIFVGADSIDQATIFSTVNLAQTKVNRSLVYDLFSFAEKPSTEKTAHEVTIALDRDPEGPFFERIKRLGVATPGRTNETLSQATVVRGILRHMPGRPEEERHKGFIGQSSEPEPRETWKRRIFAPFYRNADDVAVFKIMTNYFGAVSETWATSWEDIERESVLSRTNGYNALIRYLQDAYLTLTDEPRIVDQADFQKLFDQMKLSKKDFLIDKFRPGSTGASQLYRLLIERAPS